MDGRRLRQLRKSAGLTQIALAMKAGLALATITSIEQGAQTDIKLSTLEALAAALEVEVSDLLAEFEPEAAAS